MSRFKFISEIVSLILLNITSDETSPVVPQSYFKMIFIFFKNQKVILL